DGVSGFDVTRRLRERFGERTPGILVTGSVSAEHSDAARAQGLHFLLKPVTPAKLRTLIHFKLHPDPTAAAR
ncbi:MAG: hybrid sensor histidine kinase/response regulator, partial [Rhodocyclales bacterium CG17_big_fil_post_rev_8_21_14_2_50_68_7]